MKSELAEVCVPVMHHIHAQHTRVEEGFDVEYGKGLKMYNNASKELEGGSLREYDEVVEGYEEIRGNIANLIDRLKVEYDARDKLWADLQAQITDLADTALSDIQDAPAQVERTIAKLERHYQSQVENGGKEGGGLLNERKLKELISKLG
ncbi:hypothetical protein FA13DRAFT_1122472 [Coprinellus micaceus]|uniref:Uncharacterized protein n=1 Tax=Coprinellus micaceus TaxID=71717 RepID=A0A4Y7SVQ8_COPMI|nr:hypothetical protein FA13DRAFT_1122472 [Coprinellus micaceus]